MTALNIRDIVGGALLDVMVAERYVNRTAHPTEDLIVWNYGARAQFDNIWNDATTTCRGLITDGAGSIVARPFRKFFNLAQLDAVPDGSFVASEKMDGSLGVCYGRWGVATRGSFTSDQARFASNWLKMNPACADAVERAIAADATILTEIIYPANRIVVDYGERAELVYIATIDNATGADLADDFGWPGAKAAIYDGLDLDAILAFEAPNVEGFVLRWEDGTRAKVKLAEYLRLHKILTGVNARTVWELLANDQPLNDLIELVPDEFYKWLMGVVTDLQAEHAVIHAAATAIVEGLPPGIDRRARADIITRSEYPGIAFALLDGKPIASRIWKLLKPSASPPFREDADEPAMS